MASKPNQKPTKPSGNMVSKGLGAMGSFVAGASGLSPKDLQSRLGGRDGRDLLAVYNYYKGALKQRPRTTQEETWAEVVARFNLTEDDIRRHIRRFTMEAAITFVLFLTGVFSLASSLTDGDIIGVAGMAPFLVICLALMIRSLFRRAQAVHRSMFSLDEWRRNSDYWF